jgi:hypothetical protein
MAKAKFFYFKKSGKYYADGEGRVPDTNEVWSRAQLIEANHGRMPGLATDGRSYHLITIPDDSAEKGWPQMKLIGEE